MTDHTYDLYWIAVDPSCHGKGVGAKLLRAMGEALLHNGGRIIRVETSAQESYDGTVQFYLNNGFEMAGRIPRFYKDTDDLVILYNVLDAGAAPKKA